MARISGSRISVAKNLRRFREEARLSQRQLSDKAKISNAHISRIENGLTGIDMKTADALAEALSIPVSKLLGADESFGIQHPDRSTLQDDERALLAMFREMDEEQRYRLLLLLESFMRADQLREQIAESRRKAGLEE